jgi:hypothetical protein
MSPGPASSPDARVPCTGILSGPGEDLRGDQGSSYADGALVARNAVTDGPGAVWNVGILTDDSSNRITVRDNVVHDYVASIGGCGEERGNRERGNRPVRNIRYTGNYWDDKVPTWIFRRPYPRAWPPAPPAPRPRPPYRRRLGLEPR